MTKRPTLHKRVVGLALLILAVQPAMAVDTDGDGVDDTVDNCSEIANPGQQDSNGDGFGNHCDADINNDLIVNVLDLGLLKLAFFSSEADVDFNVDGIVNVIDLGIMKAAFFRAPGPGAVAPVATYTADVQPIFAAKCAPCHTGLGIGGHDLGTTYADAFLPATNLACTGLNKGECTIVRIVSGEMPQAAGCSGDPVLDAGNASCLTQSEQDLIQGWIDGGLAQ